MTLPLTLLACENFRKDDTGYATVTGVWRLSAADAPPGAFPVRAKRDVQAWTHGVFVDALPDESLHTGTSH